jgi:hypothetical protein
MWSGKVYINLAFAFFVHSFMLISYVLFYKMIKAAENEHCAKVIIEQLHVCCLTEVCSGSIQCIRLALPRKSTSFSPPSRPPPTNSFFPPQQIIPGPMSAGLENYKIWVYVCS